MARLDPFPGFRYAPSAGPLDRLVAPPYDVVSPAERAELAARSPCNAVHLELPEPDPSSGLDRYQAAARLLAQWRRDGLLRAEPAPALYPYETTTPDGRSSLGVVGALAIGDDVLPHEQTLPKPRSDRLDLLRSTRANLSPIWGLSLTSGLTATFAPDGEPAGEPVGDVVDDDGVRHRLWVTTDPTVHDAVCRAVDRSPLVLADGHHRYETAHTYREEVRANSGEGPGPHDAVMALVVELSEDQLSVGPIHRVVAGVDAALDVVASVGPWFEAVPAGAATEEVAGGLVSSGSLGLITLGAAWRLEPRAGAAAAAGSPVESGVVDRAIADLPGATTDHDGNWRSAVAQVLTGQAAAVFLLRPVTVAQIAESARAGQRLPPKTTYFVPKPRTGLVYRLLSEG